MHSITFTDAVNKRYTVVIDGTSITLSRAMNKIKYGDCDALSEYVDNLEQHLAHSLPLAPLSSQTNGVNMLRLLNGLFREQTIQEWTRFISKNGAIPSREAFESYFGFAHNKTVYPHEFGRELFDMSVQQHRLMKNKTAADEAEQKRLYRRDRILQKIVSELEDDVTATPAWIVEKKQIINNVTVYAINGREISFCLSGHTSLGSAKTVVEYLCSLEKAVVSNDGETIKTIITSFGGKAAFQILDCFFHDEAIRYFKAAFSSYVLSERKQPAPCAYLKSYFGGSCGFGYPYYLELISALETQLPALEERLIKSSKKEMSKNSDKWILFYRKQSLLRNCTIHFPDLHPLREEMRQYYQYLYDSFSSSGDEAFSNMQIQNCAFLKLLKHRGTQGISSALDLTSWDIRAFIAGATSTGKQSFVTIRGDLFCIRSFLYHLAPQAAETILPLSIIPPQATNATHPIETSVIEKITEHRFELPEYVWLAFQVFAETGARAGSVFTLTTEDIVDLDGHWVARMYYKKASGRKAESGTPSYVVHSISDSLAESLQSYILKTAGQRALLPKNYIFVYQCETFRTDTNRKPSVLTSGAFSRRLQKLCREHCIYDHDGQLPFWSARSIRAEVGRSLFSRGASPETVAAKLGNTPAVAKMHYDSMYPADEANMRRALYEQTLEATVTQTSCPAISKITPMYGSCEADRECHNKNDCRNCSQRIEKRA